MYLIHNTTNGKIIKQILLDKKLKSPYLTGIINEGEGIYKPNEQKFVYFSVIDKLDSKYKIYSDVTLYFDYKLLNNRTFYIGKEHNFQPDIYHKKYEKYYKYTKKILNNLFNFSIKVLSKGKAFQVFQQVSIKNQCNLNNLVKIKFQKKKPSKLILEIINKNYPNVILEYKK